ncbi:pentatricopeptide repeat-containing protein At3g09040, mitochondrial [Mercurialis annua]|uniref:pentatricopeptide repeat-containing protein At3g09040, mitochondrial n=1 Tax=Mercurialis annua TaxID=3986 RepID=UPI002160811A|nr:pentatricopeptide repeat-containing protein At3g09040, mitochondrial [Mercurialis annua]XP_050207921.1 pentatricopeptide repeat-containing protein At3g09040, mitochondrial [Mercurialis annua]XP_050207933.1 pentatricopeptide repeat-containing protein At3g09040, mitochondrial [Mercurialis annua]XP_055960348.1 pentatricopeptide repeat-containing protein At3g09040, mitochondrial [Mercurialis annua]XP_055960349.1 pentatricopeptide repeat-containing protein At3g09040, mitochondrial [Mercurialis an
MRLRCFYRTFEPSNPHYCHLHLTFSTIPFDPNHFPHTPQFHRFNHILQSCLRKCEIFKSQHLFDEMPQRLSHLSTTCKIIHSQTLQLGFWSKGYLGNAILDLYTKCGNVDSAEKVFHTLENRDIFAWNSILSMYSKLRFLDMVLKCYATLWSHGMWPNEFTFAIVLSSCARLESVESGRLIHCHVVKMGFMFRSFCVAALIDLYAKCNSMSDCRRVADGGVDLDTVSWTSLIAGYVKAGLPEEALQVFEEMKRVGREPDQVAVVTVMNAYVGLGRLDDAFDLFSKMPNSNVVAWNVMISGHAQRGHEAKAVELFQEMRRVGIKSTRSTLGSVLSAIASLTALDFGLLVHAEAMKQGLDSNVYVGSSLINMYAKCEKIEAAKKIFDTLDERNVILWNAILGGFAQNGCAHKVMELFSDMKSSGFYPDEFTYTSILSACSCLEHLGGGRQLHSAIIKNKFASNLFVGNALIDMYAKSGVLDDARKQFELMKHRDNVSWNAIIVGYVQEEDEVEAFLMFQKMHSVGIMPDEVSLASILSACANVKGLEQGKQMQCLSVKSGLETSLYAGSSLIDMYAKCDELGSARKILSCMPERSVVSMNALIAGYAPIILEEAVILFKIMQAEGLNPSEITFVSLLDACGGPQLLNLGTQIHCLILKRGLQYDDEFLGISLLGMYMRSMRKTDAGVLFSEFSNPKSTILWTAMISGLAQNDCSGEALQFYREMRSCNSLPDQATFVSVLRACAVLSSMREGREIHSLIFHTSFDLDELTCSALIDMYAKCGDLRSSTQIFEEMLSKNNVISWNSMIVGFAKHGYAEDALRVFDEMKQTHVTPDDVTFLGVLTACSHAGRISEGRQIFDSMVNYYRIQPRVDHCACMVDLLGRWGYLEEAEEFICKLSFEPHDMIWNTMLGACRIHGDDVRGQRAAEKLIELEPQNSSPYVLLSNIYAASGNWDGVNILRRGMKEKGVKKFPGCSWIVVGEETNYFVAGHMSHHSSAEQIDVLLKDLTGLMREDGYSTLMDIFIEQ